jgi:hypothetical protein
LFNAFEGEQMKLIRTEEKVNILLTPDEAAIIRQYRCMNEEYRHCIRETVRGCVGEIRKTPRIRLVVGGAA